MRIRRAKSNLRINLGLSQDHMALWLGVSRSLYSMYEASQRSLPTEALMRYVKLQQAWQAFESRYQSPTLPPPVNQAPDVEVERKIRVLQYKIFMLKRALEKLDEQPDFHKIKAFFETTTTSNDAEALVRTMQLNRYENEAERIAKQKSLMRTELLSLEKQLEVWQQFATEVAS